MNVISRLLSVPVVVVVVVVALWLLDLDISKSTAFVSIPRIGSCHGAQVRLSYNQDRGHQLPPPSPQGEEEPRRLLEQTSPQIPKPTTGRKKKNKYDQFSKVEDGFDPFDQLLSESTQKLKELELETQRRKEQRRLGHGGAANAQLLQQLLPSSKNNNNKVQFPDTKNINPYDPTTFGYIEVAHVTGAHGVNGWLKVQATTGFPKERLCTPGLRHLKPKAKRAPRQVVLLQGKHRMNQEYLIQLQHVTDRDAALQLRGSTLYVREEDKRVETVSSSSSSSSSTSFSQKDKDDNQKEEEEEEEEEEYILSDLVGLEVRMMMTPKEGDPTTQQPAAKMTFIGRVNGLVLAEEMCVHPELGHDTLEIVLQKGPVPCSFRDELVLVPLVRPIVPKVDLRQGYILIDPPAGLLDLTYVRSERVRLKGFLAPSTTTTPTRNDDNYDDDGNDDDDDHNYDDKEEE
ncbi:hypothetical protein ACA910_010313 [Epithemia clementina (nom. ined.)]